MYNAHRGMVPAPNSRLTELLDQLRQEFETQSRSTGEFEHQCMSPNLLDPTIPLRPFFSPSRDRCPAGLGFASPLNAQYRSPIVDFKSLVCSWLQDKAHETR